jgi:polyhydroxybutyrate depolymerase
VGVDRRAGDHDGGAPDDALAPPDASATDRFGSDAGTDASADVIAADATLDSGPPRQVPGCLVAPPAERDTTWSLMHEGIERRFDVHLPPGYAMGQPTPVVLDFHGFGSNAGQQALLTQVNPKADAAGFIAVHPEGTGLLQSWNAGLCCGEALDENRDDVGFVRALLDTLEEKLCVDPRRVYAMGMSNGGFFSHRLACELSDRIAAVAPVAGVLGLPSCTPARPVPVMHFHGTADPLVPYDGGSPSIWPYPGTPPPMFPSAPSTFMGWATRDGCTDPEPTTTYAQGEVRCATFASCRGGASATLCTVQGGGHTWPGGTPVPFLGHTTTDISATDAAWEFFAAHPLP